MRASNQTTHYEWRFSRVFPMSWFAFFFAVCCFLVLSLSLSLSLSHTHIFCIMIIRIAIAKEFSYQGDIGQKDATESTLAAMDSDAYG
jgi:glucose-6-phosphate-specific signal transduction histidine kinase